MPIRRTIVVIIVAAAALIVGGSFFAINGLNEGPAVRSRAVATSTPKATKSAEPVDEEQAAKDAAAKAAKGLAVGAELTAEQAKAVSHYWQGTQLAYATADGKNILIDRNQPLPETVKADAASKVAAAAQASAAANDTMNEGLEKTKNSLTSTTGHSVIIVAHVNTFLAPSYESTGWTWVSSAIGAKTQFGDAVSAVAASQPYATSGIEIIVSP